MNKQYRLLKEALLHAYPYCEVCGTRKAKEVNHCYYHVHGGIYDGFENCQAVCCECRETRRDSTKKEKDRHIKKRCGEMGAAHMIAWNIRVSKYRRVWW